MSDEPKKSPDGDAAALSGVLNRRDLLRAGVASGAAMALLGGCRETEGDGKELGLEDLDWPKPGEEVEVDAADKCPDRNERRAALPSPDEEIETALDFMWCEFERAAQSKTKDIDIDYEAIVLARSRLRWRVRKYFEDLADDNSPEEILTMFAEVGGGYTTQFKADWKATAEDAATAAVAGTITQSILSANWKGDQNGKEPELNVADEGTELAGSHLWYHFTRGTLALPGSVPGFSLDTLKKGRELSRFFVRLNVSKKHVSRDPAPGEKYKHDLKKWNWLGVKECSFRAGLYAALLASKANSPTIDPGIFEEAWCMESKIMKTAIRLKLRRDNTLEIFTSAC